MVELPMDYAFFYHGQKAIAELLEHVDAVLLGYLFAWFHDGCDVPIAEFLNDVIVLAAFHDLQKPNNIW